MAEDIRLIVGEIKGQLKSLTELYSFEMQRIYNTQKENTEFLKGEVSHALNSHAQIKKDIELLKDKTFHCPIMDVDKRVKSIESDTEMIRIFGKYPDVKKGQKLWELLKTIGIIIIALAALLSFYLDIKNGIGK